MTTSSEIEAAIAELRAALAAVDAPGSQRNAIERLLRAARKLAAMPTTDVRRAPVQGGPRKLWREVPGTFIWKWADGYIPSRDIPQGSIPWADHLRVYAAYAAHYGDVRSAEIIAEGGGFCFEEIIEFDCADVLERWEPR